MLAFVSSPLSNAAVLFIRGMCAVRCLVCAQREGCHWKSGAHSALLSGYTHWPKCLNTAARCTPANLKC